MTNPIGFLQDAAESLGQAAELFRKAVCYAWNDRAMLLRKTAELYRAVEQGFANLPTDQKFIKTVSFMVQLIGSSLVTGQFIGFASKYAQMAQTTLVLARGELEFARRIQEAAGTLVANHPKLQNILTPICSISQYVFKKVRRGMDAGRNVVNRVRGRLNRLLGRGRGKGLIGKDFEDFLVRKLNGRGSFKVGGREFDGAVGNTWYEAKSGQYWEMLQSNSSRLGKFKSDMGRGLEIASRNRASYMLHSNTPIPQSIKIWLTRKGIKFVEW